jgi:hypothetical protein
VRRQRADAVDVVQESVGGDHLDELVDLGGEVLLIDAISDLGNGEIDRRAAGNVD